MEAEAIALDRFVLRGERHFGSETDISNLDQHVRQTLHYGKRIEGRKGYAETNPELVRTVKRFTHGNRKQRLSLRAISKQLTDMGYVNGKGEPFSAAQVKRLLAA